MNALWLLIKNFQFTCQVLIWHAPSAMMHMRHSLCWNVNDAMFCGGDRWDVLFICTVCKFWCIVLHLFPSTGIYAWEIFCGRFTFRKLGVNDDIVSMQILTWRFWQGVISRVKDPLGAQWPLLHSGDTKKWESKNPSWRVALVLFLSEHDFGGPHWRSLGKTRGLKLKPTASSSHLWSQRLPLSKGLHK